MGTTPHSAIVQRPNRCVCYNLGMQRKSTLTWREKSVKYVVLFCTLVLGVSCATASPHKVKVSGKDKESNSVIEALKARLRGTERYQVTDDSSEADLEVVIICSALETYKVNGVICSYIFFFTPPSAKLLRLPIGSAFGQAEAADRTALAEMILEAFVAQTTERKIIEVENDLKASVAIFCVDPKNNAAFCKLK
jgi:hypothetical protein